MGTATLRRFSLAAASAWPKKASLAAPRTYSCSTRTNCAKRWRAEVSGKPRRSAPRVDGRLSQDCAARPYRGAERPECRPVLHRPRRQDARAFCPSSRAPTQTSLRVLRPQPGTVQGTAKVVRSLLEASKLQPGDIMVCEMTVPTWVPLFARSAGSSPIRAAS